MKTRFKMKLHSMLKSRGKMAFLKSLPPHAETLDVGCGNASPMKAKTLRPDIIYVGLDVGDYNQARPEEFADRYQVVEPTRFAEVIEGFEGRMDAVISSHNIEHCDEPERVLSAMLKALKPGGRLYISFPCEESVNFPRRAGTLNFYDDKTHHQVPVWSLVCSSIQSAKFRIEFSSKRYRPFLLTCFGLLLEPVCALSRRSTMATWALYGFESVIWASLPHSKRIK